MKVLVSALLAVELLAGCNRQKPPTEMPDPRSWFVESYDNGVITVQHEGKKYRAKCDISRSFNNTDSITDPNDVHTFSSCDLVVAVVGRNVQPFEGEQKDASGWITKMWNVGSVLALRSWRDEHTPWRLDEFTITSVANTGGNQ